jgi:hypothetical protein
MYLYIPGAREKMFRSVSLGGLLENNDDYVYLDKNNKLREC